MKRLIAALISLTAFTHCFSQQKPQGYHSQLHTYNLLQNKTFAQLQLEDTSGNLVSTTSFAGKTVYVDFWFTACPPCIAEIPHSKKLQQYFEADTNVVFVNICIENIDRKAVWKQMIQDRAMPGVHLFHARNRPQQVNLLREYNITFPTYLLLNKQMKVIGYNAPRPSETPFVHWAILQACQNISLADAYKALVNRSPEFVDFLTSTAK